LIEHNFDFTHDYQASNPRYLASRLDPQGQPKREFLTRTGHLDNHFSVGPAILWAPFLLFTHALVLIARSLGSTILADGFSDPYRYTAAFVTALSGFLSLLISFRFSIRYLQPRWAFLGTLTIWGASSLPVYMYFNPFWSHAQSAFAVALFVYYWDATRKERSRKQWFILGLIAGLMLNVYYPNLVLLSLIFTEIFAKLFNRGSVYIQAGALHHEFENALIFVFTLFISLIPTFTTKYVVYGSPFSTGYVHFKDWLWGSPQFGNVLFASNHGLITWTPVILLSLIGLILAATKLRRVGGPLLVCFVCFYLLIAFYPDWAGISSFGNRFFISLTTPFIFGLSYFYQSIAARFSSSLRATLMISFLSFGFMIWNAGLIFQWGLHMIPVRGPVSIRQAVHNQISLVPERFSEYVRLYFVDRRSLMLEIERLDMEQLKTTGEN
jgi:hypothetical protein